MTLSSVHLELSYICKKFRWSIENFYHSNFVFITALHWLSGTSASIAPNISTFLLLSLMPFYLKLRSRARKICLIAFFIPVCMHAAAFSHPPFLHPHRKSLCKQKNPNFTKKMRRGFTLSIKKQFSITTKQGPLNDILESNFKSNCFSKRFIEKMLETRSHLRIFLINKIQSRVKSTSSSQFLQTLLLGSPPEKLLRERFSSLGISHILVVSGFHFFVLQRVLYSTTCLLPPKFRPWTVLSALTLFCWILPYSPSTLRAWIGTTLAICSLLARGHCSSFNRLGVSLIICATLFPNNSMSFILTFLSTASIMLFSPKIAFSLKNILHKLLIKTHESTTNYSLLIRTLNYLVNSFSLTIASQILLLPIMANYFGKITLSGILYSFFISPLIYPLFCLSLLALCTNIPLICRLTDGFATCVLDQIILKDFFVFKEFSLPHLSTLVILCYILVVFALGIFLRTRSWKD